VASTPTPVAPAVPAQDAQSAPTEAQVGLSVTDVRRLWPEVLEEVKGKRRFTWILLSQNARVAELRNGTLLLALSNAGARDSFARGGNEDVLREAIVVVMGADFAVETMVDPSATPAAGALRTPQAAQAPTPGAAADSPVTRATNGAQNTMADDPDEAASRDDSDLTEDAQSHTELLARHLGAEIIAEEEHGA
ncbi:MAG TPA: DNA polymerase III subunit gamma/tau, partial [Propionibacteriaceae bacterium]|nr:DNA polymerase III subunit gamma/tau [Propionibacteriaceae bacterium]